MTDTVEGIAAGTISPNAARYVQVPISASGKAEGEPDEAALLRVLQGAGLVSLDVRACYVELQHADHEAVLHVMDVDSEDTVAWVRIPMGAGV